MPLVDFRDGYDGMLLAGRMTRAQAVPCPPTGGITNRVWYVPSGFEVRWVTPLPDPTGVSYPGPGTYGVDTTQYTVDDPARTS